MWSLLVLSFFSIPIFCQKQQYNYTEYPIEYGQIFRLVANATKFNNVSAGIIALQFYGADAKLCLFQYSVQIWSKSPYMIVTTLCLKESKRDVIYLPANLPPFFIFYFFFSEGYFTTSTGFAGELFSQTLLVNLTEQIKYYVLWIDQEVFLSFGRLVGMPDNWEKLSKEVECLKKKD